MEACLTSKLVQDIEKILSDDKAIKFLSKIKTLSLTDVRFDGENDL